MDDWQERRRRRNLALALTLLGLVVMLYAVSFVKTRELEDQRHREDPQAHSLAPKAPP
ncbi:hypothetical protein VB618_16925 [Microvirga sp. CF3062]|uniref:hypothetical protein n=1 Tax=Microvirga sp. CF3062 TaxID=3110182 RepID=UPI002E76FD86|nr:hypothetical protein [Microvirga sp. CF3062]MEE1657886.1 hypothetical protein [Microvirga sp. CF3062]